MGESINALLCHLNLKLSVLFTFPFLYQAYSPNKGTEVHKPSISHYIFTNL
jgi:hypothetical protein